jgi:diguanylate cyclase (GGDEF)-like protein
MGATDFISKPFSALDIISRAGSYAKLNQKIATLEQNVTHDGLTELLNKQGLQELGEKAIAGAHRHQFELSILTMQIADIDGVLSKYGKKITEQIIVSVANSLKKTLRQEDVLAHLGSGRFVLLLPMTKAFRAHIVGLRFQKTIDNLAFQTDDEIIRIQLASGLNSTEGYNEHLTFAELSLQAEKALEASLQDRASKIVRHDETLIGEEDSEKHSESSELETQESIGKELAADLQKLDTAVFNRYMSAIMTGEFEKIPVQDVENMIEPLESFLKYAYNQLQTELENYKKKT